VLVFRIPISDGRIRQMDNQTGSYLTEIGRFVIT